MPRPRPELENYKGWLLKKGKSGIWIGYPPKDGRTYDRPIGLVGKIAVKKAIDAREERFGGLENPSRKQRGNQTNVKVSKGIYYFPTYESARAYAMEHGKPVDRIISYVKGWAIQLRKSGDYVGPNNNPMSGGNYWAVKDDTGKWHLIYTMSYPETSHGYGFNVSFADGPHSKDKALKIVKRNNKRSNPGLAEEISTGFHGRPPSETIDIDEEEQYTEELGVLGCLVELHITRDGGETSVKLRFPIPSDPKFKEGDEVYLAAANKHQLEMIGGDQEIVNLDEIAKYTDKQLVKLGCLDKIVYLTDKYHLDDSDGKEAEYVHELGKKKMFGFSNKRTGRPEVIYDSLNQQLKLVGGTYEITPEGIIN